MRGIEWESAATVRERGMECSPSPSLLAQRHPHGFAEALQFSEAWVVDLTHLGPKALIEVSDLGEIANQFKEGQSLLLHTGWSHYVDDPDYYRSSFQRISEGLAKWCVEKKVCALGVEPPSVADVFNLEEVTTIHHILLKGQVVIV